MSEVLERYYCPKLHENDKQLCERDITWNECWDAFKSMGNNKSLGNDDLTKEFCLAFFTELRDYLLQSLNFLLIMVNFLNLKGKRLLPWLKKVWRREAT